MLTQLEIDTVQSDWRNVLPIAATAATLFYDRLFELDPSLRALFTSDLDGQKKKLLQTLGVAVTGLTDLPALVPIARALGKRHVGYGVKPEHYGTVGTALLWTLRKGLGGGFDAAHEAAWTKVYEILSKTMLDGAAGA
jgi:hemoglobin-like flavoprotein